MDEVLIDTLHLKKGSDEYHRVLFALTKPEGISTTLKEKQAGLQETLAIKKKTQTIERASKKLARAYGWMPVFTYGTPWDAEHYMNELGSLVQQDIGALEKEYSALKNYSVIRAREIKEIVKAYHITPRDLHVFSDFGVVIDTHNEAEYLVSLGGFYLLPMYKEIARRLGLSVKQVRTLYEEEIILALRGKIDPLNVLHKKSTVFGYGYDHTMTKRTNFTSSEARTLLTFMERNVEHAQGSNEAQGVCASPGTVRGVVRIVMTPEENDKVKKGDIMIAHATTVDYLPAMKNAAAIVTEVGGLTCHAAVVSREFGIPCVVGLKNATKNFKDGDRVEVEASKGVVRCVR
ncbi:MAG TPA: hypothetical protein DEF59_00955 [Candidatus Magasanikbacteria bacterium]|nr:hypothetical protein [Candidatus Magasanikbacteria bacterium]